MKSITKNLLESLNNDGSGMTIREVINNLYDGSIDIDVTDTEIDILANITYDGETDNGEYDKFIDNIISNVVVEKINDNNMICRFTDYFSKFSNKLENLFNMEFSEFDKPEEEVTNNLPGLLSGNASENLYIELNKILSNKEIVTESEEMIVDYDVLQYLIDEKESYGSFPEYEEFNDEFMECSKEEYNKIIKQAQKISNLPTYNGYLELSDNHTLNAIDNLDEEHQDSVNKAYEVYTMFVGDVMRAFEEDTGVEIFQDGRSGRHIVVKDTIENRLKYDELKKKQEEYEKEVINLTNRYVQGVNNNVDDAYQYAISGEEQTEMNESVNIDMNNLTKEQLWKLRQEIVLGSIYTDDYQNSFGISPSAVQSFFDSFIEDTQMDDEGKPNDRKSEEYDNQEDLYNYYVDCENPFGLIESVDEGSNNLIDKLISAVREYVNANNDKIVTEDSEEEFSFVQSNYEVIIDKKDNKVYLYSKKNKPLSQEEIQEIYNNVVHIDED